MQVGYSSNPSEDTFWDEEGVYHEHYLSGDVFSFVCANGHRWKSQRRLKCNVDNCDWNRLPEEAVK